MESVKLFSVFCQATAAARAVIARSRPQWRAVAGPFAYADRRC